MESSNDWTRSNVTPVFKKGSRHLPSNYRPISLTSLIVNIMERLISSEITKFTVKHNILSPLQHGFRQGHSCQTQLLETIHQLAESLNSKSSTHVIFLDFSKAFDSVPHKRLLIKLHRIGIRGQLLQWIEAFISKRQQRVVVDGQSEWSPVTSGVPQGSILGPLLFLIYVNDIGHGLKSQARLFADDCTIFREVSSKSDIDALQCDLVKIYQWTQKWQLHLNLSKCKAICISNKRSPPSAQYLINNVPLQWVDTFKYLGITINQKLKWDDHSTNAVLKASRMLNLLRRNMRGCSKSAKSKAYTALVRPHLEYCVPVWAPHTMKYQHALEKVQKRAARWICAKWDRSTYRWTKSYDECCNILGWTSLQVRRDILSYCQLYKIIHNLDCIAFDQYFCLSPLNHTRSHNLSILCKSSNIDAYRHSFFIRLPFLWNSLPSDVVNASSHRSFKCQVAAHLANFI